MKIMTLRPDQINRLTIVAEQASYISLLANKRMRGSVENSEPHRMMMAFARIEAVRREMINRRYIIGGTPRPGIPRGTLLIERLGIIVTYAARVIISIGYIYETGNFYPPEKPGIDPLDLALNDLLDVGYVASKVGDIPRIRAKTVDKIVTEREGRKFV